MRREGTDGVVYVAHSLCGIHLTAGHLVTSAAAWTTCLECRELRPEKDVAVGIRLEHPRTLLTEAI